VKLIRVCAATVIVFAAMPFAFAGSDDGGMCIQIDGNNIVGECEDCESRAAGLIGVAINICS
jgi:hypothetical protein